MTGEEFKQYLLSLNFRHLDASWILGVNERHIRAWCAGKHKIPQYAILILRAYEQGLISMFWLIQNIDNKPPV